MAGFPLAAAASIAAGLVIGAAATVGVTLAVGALDDTSVRVAPATPAPAGPYLVNYGSRCWHGHCVPWP
jgi:hypothetical protein